MSDDVIIDQELTALPEVSAEPVASVESAQDDAPKLNKYESAAIAKGWKPKDQFSGDLDEFRPAKEWLERGELLDTIHSQNREVKALKETVEHLAVISKKVEETTRSRVIAELEAKHRSAVEIGDVDGATKAVQEMVKAQSEPVATHVAPNGPAPEVTEFVARHSEWFNQKTAENSAMSAYAIRRESEIVAAHPSIPMKDALAIVEADVRKTFPHKFVSAPVAAVSAPSAAPTRSREIGVSQLPEFHQKMVKTLQRSIKDFDVKGYINNLRKAGEIK